MNIEDKMGSFSSVQIIGIERNNVSTRTLTFNLPHLDCDIEAGEFVMVWVPGIDEIPMSISYWDPPIAGITVKAIGEATNRLVQARKDDWIGIRGPFGNHFTLATERALVVGGGIGIAPLRPLVLTLLRTGKSVSLLAGAKTQTELILYDFDTINEKRFHLEISTDDGSVGKKGYATDIAQQMLDKKNYDRVYACGPEIMTHKLYLLANEHNTEFEASLERYMKCGCGLCGTCGIDPYGELVCLDGPIFTGVQLGRMKDFGQFYRNSTGQKKQY